MEQELELALSLIGQTRNIVALTGAGISSESGIPTFREVNGLWERFDPACFGSVSGIKNTARDNPLKLLDFIDENLQTFLRAAPNSSHRFLASLQRNHHLAVVTQNVDDLHEQAGTESVYKIHGDLYSFRCLQCHKLACGMRNTLQNIQQQAAALRRGGQKITTAQVSGLLPRCSCGGYMRPEIVLFGEGVVDTAWEQASEALTRANLLLVVGTSAEVYPASTLPKLAYQMNIPVIEINPHPVLKHNSVTINAPAAAAFSALARRAVV